MEFRRKAVGQWGEINSSGGYIYLNDEGLYNLYNQNPTLIGWPYLERRIGEQIVARPSFHATYLWTQSNYNSTNAQPSYSLAFPNWYTYIHPKIKEKLQMEYPLFDDNSVVRFSFWPARGYVAGFLNNYANAGDTNTLPYGVYYARKNWIEVEWATSHPHNHNPWVNYPYAGAGTTYIANITSFSGEYYPRYLSSNGAIYVSTQVAVKAGQNILVNSQTNPSQNGVYRVTAGAWIKLSQPAYPSIVYVWGYYASTNYLSNYTVFTYVRGFDSSNSLVKFFLQTSDTTFSSNYQYWTYTQTSTGNAGYTQGGTWNSVSYPAGLGFYLYHTLNDALNNTNKIPYTAAQSDETLNSAPYGQLSIDENHIQHLNDYHTDYYFSPIDYTYPSFKFVKGIGCCYTYDEIQTEDIPNNAKVSAFGTTVNLHRLDASVYEEVTSEQYGAAYASRSVSSYWGYSSENFYSGNYFYTKYNPNIAYSNKLWRRNALFTEGVSAGTFSLHSGIQIRPSKQLIRHINPVSPFQPPYIVEQEFQNGIVAFISATYELVFISLMWTWPEISGYQTTSPYGPIYSGNETFANGSYEPQTYNYDSYISSQAGSATYYRSDYNAMLGTFTYSPISGIALNPLLPSSVSVTYDEPFTLPNQLRLNMPNSFFPNSYSGIDPAQDATKKRYPKVFQDPISVGNINVLLTLDKNDGVYYSEVMTLGGIKGQFRIATNAYQKKSLGQPANKVPNLNSWVTDGWNFISGSNPFFSSTLTKFDISQQGFAIIGQPYLRDTSSGYYITKQYEYKNINLQWYSTNTILGTGYETGLPEGTIWMDTRVSGNSKNQTGAHLGSGNSAWCAIMFSEWQDLRTNATNTAMYYNTIGPNNLQTVIEGRDIFNNQTAWSLLEGGPMWTPTTDFYKRNHYYVQSNDPNCWLSSLSV